MLDRPDLPNYRRAERLFDSEKPELALPLIAGMDSRERSGVLVVEKLGEERVPLGGRCAVHGSIFDFGSYQRACGVST